MDFNFHRDQIARYGLSIAGTQDTLMIAVGGEPVAKTIEGRERYGVNLRYLADYRSNIEALKHVLVTTPNGTPRS